MPTSDVFYRRNLPHYHLSEYPLFITFRLADSIPSNVLAKLKTQRENEVKTLRTSDLVKLEKLEQKYFHLYDEWLDRCEMGPQWLHDHRIAQIVMKEIYELISCHYNLMACCIMPNHVHLLIECFHSKRDQHMGRSAKYPVTDTLRLLKGRTARFCNLELSRSGKFWQHESYDHVVRSDEELSRTVLYILNNPVKAGLVRKWRDWEYTYINPELGEW
jgi:putative transposase